MLDKHLKIKKKTKRGFTLVETLIAILIFAISFTMLAATFSSFLKNYNEAKRAQRNMENAQYAMNLMAKTIRTSFVESPGDFSLDSADLDVFDYSQGLCVKYTLVNNAIMPAARSAGDPSGCNCSTMNADTALTLDNIQSAYVSATPSSGETLGRVTVFMSVGDSEKSFPIQMSVSLRQ